MLRKAGGTPFKLRSGSPFRNEKQRMYIKEDAGNRLVDVTKGKETKGTYTYKMMYNDLMADGKSADEAKKQVDLARTSNMEKYGTHNPTAEGKTDNTVVTGKEPDKIENVASDGTDGTEGNSGSKMDTFSPQDSRMASRDYKINANRLGKSNKQAKNTERRINKNLGKAGYIQGMVAPQEFTKDADGNEVPNVDYSKQKASYDANEQIKSNFMNSRKGIRLSERLDRKESDADFYGGGRDRAIMGAEQGVNPNKGRQIEYGDKDDVMTKASSGTSGTEGSDVTYVKDTEGMDEYTSNLAGGSPMRFQRHYGGSPFKLNKYKK